MPSPTCETAWPHIRRKRSRLRRVRSTAGDYRGTRRNRQTWAKLKFDAGGRLMRWGTTTFRIAQPSSDLTAALKAWKQHIGQAHPQIKEVRCAMTDGGTQVMWQEGFEDFHAYQQLIESEDDVCEKVMGAVFRHAVPGTRAGRELCARRAVLETGV